MLKHSAASRSSSAGQSTSASRAEGPALIPVGASKPPPRANDEEEHEITQEISRKAPDNGDQVEDAEATTLNSARRSQTTPCHPQESPSFFNVDLDDQIAQWIGGGECISKTTLDLQAIICPVCFMNPEKFNSSSGYQTIMSAITGMGDFVNNHLTVAPTDC